MNKQRAYKWAGIFVVVFLVLTETPLMTVFLKFLILGEIPGTDTIIPAWVILLLYPSLIVGGIAWIRSQPIFIGETTPPPKPEVVPILPPRATQTVQPKKVPAKRPARANV